MCLKTLFHVYQEIRLRIIITILLLAKHWIQPNYLWTGQFIHRQLYSSENKQTVTILINVSKTQRHLESKKMYSLIPLYKSSKTSKIKLYPRINTSREHRVSPDNSSRQLLALCPVTIPELTAGQGAQLPSFWPGSHCGSFPLDRAGSRVNTIITWDGLPWERRVLLPGEQRTMSTYILLVALCI